MAAISAMSLLRPSYPPLRRRFAVSCLLSGVDNGGEFTSLRKTRIGRKFAVIGDMLKKIEPLDGSVISEGVSVSAKDSMKQTISKMLGLLPAEQFDVSVRVSKRPLDRLLMSSIITGIEPLDGSVISEGVSVSAKDSRKQTISKMLGLLPAEQFDVSVRVSKSPLDRLLMSSIITADMLRRIEPLDGSVMCEGVSISAKGSMKQTISKMLLLPAEQFDVGVRVSKRPLDRLLMSSIITRYTLWNAEYRISLMRNFNIPTENWKRPGDEQSSEVLKEKRENSEEESGENGVGNCLKGMENISLQSLENLSPEAQSYIQELELELSLAKKELDAKKQDNMQMECNRESHNDLLEYLRSLEADMVNELSRPSSIEVEEITHHLVQNILRNFFEDESSCEFNGDFAAMNSGNVQNGDEESPNTVCASRDYLAKLLFWCMLLGHHLRGLENRLHQSCVVGLL